MNRRLVAPLFAALIPTLAACPKPEPTTPEAAVAETALTIEHFSPTGTTTTQPLELRFNQPLVTAAELGSAPKGASPLLITPDLPGHLEWRSENTLVFVPSEPFRPSTRYQVSVRADAFGRELSGETRFQFNTELFSLESVEPFFTGARGGKVRLNLVFTHPVRPDDVRAAVLFRTPDGSTVPATLATRSPAKVMAFDLGAVAPSIGELTVRVDGGLAAAGGGDPIGKEVVRKIPMLGSEELKVHNFYPSESGGSFTIWIRFSADVDTETAARYLSVSPAVAIKVVDSYHGVGVTGPFEPGRTYTLKIAAGLPSTSGAAIPSDVERPITIPELDPSIAFEGLGNYLMRSGAQAFQIKTINVGKLQVTVSKVPDNNLAHVIPRLRGGAVACQDEACEYYDEYGVDESSYYSGYDLGSLGSQLFTGEIEVESTRNQAAVTTVPFSEIEDDERRGVYRVRVASTEQSWVYTERWMLATDLGLTAKVGPTEARVQVVSLRGLGPQGGVKIRFLSRTNELLGLGVTDRNGVANLSLDKQRPGEPLSLITAEYGGDFSYLPIAGTEIPTADFDVGGDGESTAPYEAYVYADRGVYRPGDKAHVVALLRDRALRTPPSFPFEVEVRDPKWRVFDKRRGNTSEDGGAEFRFDIPSDAPTGSYVVRVLSPADGALLGRLGLKVEEFMPDRIKVDVKAEASVGELSDASLFRVESAYLFGPPASGLRLESRCRFREVSIQSKDHRSFPMAVDEDYGHRRALDETRDLGETSLDDAGLASLGCELEASDPPRRPVEVSLYATVSENGGRAVTGVGRALAHAHPHYVGVRRRSNDRYVEQKKDAGLEVLVVDRGGATQAGVQVEATFWSIEWKSILKLVNGRYRYVSERTPKKIGTAKVTSGAAPVKLPYVPAEVGMIRVDVETQPAGAKSSTSFWVSGGGYAAWEMSTPDQVQLTFAREDYAVGETATAMVRAPFTGKLYLSVERDSVLWSRVVDLVGNTGTVEIPVTDEMIPNAYLTAQLVRAPGSTEKMAPMRAFGVVPLRVRSDRHALGVDVFAEDTLRPRQTLDVKVKVSGGRGPARVTIAAVDEGILRITNFASPSPLRFFSRKRRLGVRTHDLFDLMLPEARGRASAIVKASGGDEARKRHLTPMSVKRVEPVALWSGIVNTDAEGWARAPLELPEFQGSLRVMVVAFAGDRFGAAEKNVTVRDPIVLTPTLPRFLGPLDVVKVPVEVYNGTGSDGAITVSMRATGGAKARGPSEQKIDVPAGAQRSLSFELAADEVDGKIEVVFAASGNGASTERHTRLPVRAPSTTVTEGTPVVVTADQPAKIRVKPGFVRGSVTTRVSVGAAPAARFGASLQYLLQYPHGCVEQTTSRAFPLLYVRELAEASSIEVADAKTVDDLVNAGVARLFSMQERGGGLSYWPGGSYGYPWSTTYAAHFLVEAKKAGFAVDQAALDRLMDHLGRIARAAPMPEYRGRRPGEREQAYAMYVLALAERPLTSALSHAATRLDEQKRQDPELRALVDGGLLLAGVQTRKSAFGAELPLAEAGPPRGFWSATRADALMLSVLADVWPTHKSVPILMDRLGKSASVGRWGNTQENAYALLALGKIGKRLGTGEFWGTVRVGGDEVKKFNHGKAISVVHAGDDWVGKDVELTLTGPGAAFASVTVEGIKPGVMPPKSAGLDVKREYLDRNGAALDPATLSQGDLVVTKITVTVPGSARIENLAVVDLLPAGLEIENPRLSDEAAAPWMRDRAVPDYMDIRDDRIVLFTSGSDNIVFYYTARAVSAGDFVLPNVHAEAMYDPSVHAWSGGGKLSVKAR
jgi:uncharacterized protein YfaS (alpha-2-macroglobulin family)